MARRSKKSEESGRAIRQRYNAEFRAEALRLLKERQADGASASQVAPELGLNPSVLWQWANASAAVPSAQDRSTGETLEQEVRRLRREVAILKQEREFAKKAAAFFARESQ